MKFKPLPSDTNSKSKIKKDKPKYISLKDINKYLANRKMAKLSVKENRVTITMTDERKVIVVVGPDKSKFKVKRYGQHMTARELQEFNYQVETAIARMKKEVPRECRNCMKDIDLTP